MDNPRELIIEYLRGELEGEEKQAFEKLLAEDADFKNEVDKQKNLWELFGKMPEVEASKKLKENTLHAVKHYKNKSIKIRLFRLQDKLEQTKKKETRRLFAPVSAAAAFLIIAAVIITVLLSTDKEYEKSMVADNDKVAYESVSDEAKSDKNTANKIENEKLEGDSFEGSKKSDFVGYDSKAKTAISLDKGPYPDASLNRSGFSNLADPLAPGDNTSAKENSEYYEDEVEDSQPAKKFRNADNASVYAYILDLNREMDEPLTINQQLNLPTDVKGKVTTRLDLAKYEILNSIENLSKPVRIILILVEGSQFKAFKSDGTFQEIRSNTDFSLSVNENTIKLLSQSMNSLDAGNSSTNLRSAELWISMLTKQTVNLTLYSALDSPDTIHEMQGSFDTKNSDPTIEIIDTSETRGLQSWAASKGYSYSPR